MSEIRTFRCDVCGGVFHSDDKVDTEFVIHARTNDDIKTYDHICPECSSSIDILLDNPAIWDELASKEDKKDTYIRKLETILKSLGDTIFGFSFGTFNEYPKYYENLCNEIRSEWNKTKKSLDVWRVVGPVFIGAFIGLLVCTIM